MLNTDPIQKLNLTPTTIYVEDIQMNVVLYVPPPVAVAIDYIVDLLGHNSIKYTRQIGKKELDTYHFIMHLLADNLPIYSRHIYQICYRYNHNYNHRYCNIKFVLSSLIHMLPPTQIPQALEKVTNLIKTPT